MTKTTKRTKTKPAKSKRKPTPKYLQDMDRLLKCIKVMSDTEFANLQDHVRVERDRRSAQFLNDSGVELTDEEKTLAATSVIAAIKAVRQRMAISLYDAKMLVDRYRSELQHRSEMPRGGRDDEPQGRLL